MSISCQSHVNPRISLQVRRVRQTMQQLREENALIVRQLAAKGVSLDESTSQALGGVGMVVPPSPAARRGLGGSVATPRGGEGVAQGSTARSDVVRGNTARGELGNSARHGSAAAAARPTGVARPPPDAETIAAAAARSPQRRHRRRKPKCRTVDVVTTHQA